MKNFIFIIGIIVATMFVSCSKKVYEPLSENKNMLEDTLSRVNLTSKPMGNRASQFEIPENNLLVKVFTQYHGLIEDNHVWILVRNNPGKINEGYIYSQKFSISNLKEFCNINEKGYFYYIASNCYIRHLVGDKEEYPGRYLSVACLTPEEICEIKIDLKNLKYMPIESINNYIAPEEIRTKRKDRK